MFELCDEFRHERAIGGVFLTPLLILIANRDGLVLVDSKGTLLDRLPHPGLSGAPLHLLRVSDSDLLVLHGQRGPRAMTLTFLRADARRATIIGEHVGPFLWPVQATLHSSSLVLMTGVTLDLDGPAAGTVTQARLVDHATGQSIGLQAHAAARMSSGEYAWATVETVATGMLSSTGALEPNHGWKRPDPNIRWFFGNQTTINGCAEQDLYAFRRGAQPVRAHRWRVIVDRMAATDDVVVAGGAGRQIEVLALSSRSAVLLDAHKGRETLALDVIRASDGIHLLSIGNDGTVRLWLQKPGDPERHLDPSGPT